MILQKLYTARVSIYLQLQVMQIMQHWLSPAQQRAWMPPHSPNMVLKATTKSTFFFSNSLDNFGDKVP